MDPSSCPGALAAAAAPLMVWKKFFNSNAPVQSNEATMDDDDDINHGNSNDEDAEPPWMTNEANDGGGCHICNPRQSIVIWGGGRRQAQREVH
jgi:hypothetical protein